MINDLYRFQVHVILTAVYKEIYTSIIAHGIGFHIWLSKYLYL